MRSLIAMSLAALSLISLTGCERWWLDWQMEVLCKRDGGMKIYQTVTLPASEFSNIGQPLAKYERYAKSSEEILGPNFQYIINKSVFSGATANLENGQGRLEKIHEIVYRRAGNQLLGEYIWYARGGGDFYTFGFQPSSNYCPKPSVSLINSIFVKEK